MLFAAQFFAGDMLGQELPRNGSELHYRLIRFVVPRVVDADNYKLEVFDNFQGADVPRDVKAIVNTTSTTNSFVATVPAFGRGYAWKIKWLRGKKQIGSTPLYRFTVKPNPFADTSIARFRIVKNAEKYEDMFVFFDNTRSLHNMKGEPVWFLPVIQGVTDSSVGIIRDLKLTKDGTITFLSTKNIHEISYDGNILWSGPDDGLVSGDTTENYHHQVTKLSNGHYMTIGDKMVPNSVLTGEAPAKDAATANQARTACGTVIEYDKEGKVLWTWNSCDYLKQGDAVTHFNAFYFDEARKTVYTSYRNISRVVKAAYPSGAVLALYGDDLYNTGKIQGKGMFYSQHNVGVNKKGDMVLFNNNYQMQSADVQMNKRSVPTVAIFREPIAIGDTLQKIWEFRTDIDTFVVPMSSGGGSVQELEEGDYLVCAGLPGRVFIVSDDKKVLWNVLVSQLEKGKWGPASVYRVSPVRKNDLEKLLPRGLSE